MPILIALVIVVVVAYLLLKRSPKGATEWGLVAAATYVLKEATKRRV